MKDKKAKLLILTVTILYTALMIYLLFFRNRRANFDYLYNFVPFASIKEYFEIYIFYAKNYPADIANNAFFRFAVNVFGNIGVFIPYGILLPVVFKNKFIKPFIIFELGIITVEITQLITRRGVCDIDDFILNTIGFLTGYLILIIINKKRRSKKIAKI